ncbi:MAG: response regulator [bacterium]|nr:response regulator [bacterium]
MTDELQELREIFRAEATELLDELAGSLEVLGSLRADRLKKVISSCMRLAHNIKGASAIADYPEIERVAHALEDALAAHGETDDPPPSDAVDAMLDATTVMQQLLEEGAEQIEADGLLSRLGRFGEQGERTLPGVTERLGEQQSGSRRTTPATGAEKQKQSPKEETKKAVASSTRVNTARIDRVMAFAGELLIADARMTTVADRLDQLQERLRQRMREIPQATTMEFKSITAELDKIVSVARADQRSFSHLAGEVNVAAKQLRMIPLDHVAPAWRKTVRESARILGKRARLTLKGGRVEIDRSVIEKLREPVMHMLRNAIDHGIETPAERAASGKQDEGTVLIAAIPEGAMVRVEISDDGQGIDAEAVAEAAVAKGVCTQDALAGMDDREVLQLLLRSGFSTADSVSRVSGRGVGLDVLARSVADLGGHVEILSRGRLGGCTIAATLPVSLLSRRELLVRAGDALYAMPIEVVDRAVRVASESIDTFEGTDVLHIEDTDPVALRWLGEIMEVYQERTRGWLSVVVVSHGTARLGLVVDEILGETELVVRELPWNIRSTPGVNGAAILADGSLALAVDNGFLFREAFEGARYRESTRHAEIDAAKQRILVVDDSLTSRMLQRNTLEAAGFSVTMTVDGADAWEALGKHNFDLLVSDVQMPVIDGFELTRKVRNDSRLRNLPVILVTSLGRPEDVALGAEAGADEYIVKGRFEQDKLLEAVARLL